MENQKLNWGSNISRERPAKNEKNSDEKDLTPFAEGVVGEKIYEGSHANIHEINKPREDFPDRIIKIGKTEDYTPPLLRDRLKMVFSRKKVSDALIKLLGPKFQIHPDQDFIKNGVAEYLLMKEYFGHDENENKNTSSENREELIDSLKNSDSPFYKEMNRVIESNKMADVAEIIEKHKNENFLPEEQTVVGHPPGLTRKKAEELQAKGEKLPMTYYIYQEKVSGQNVVPLYQLDENEFLKYPELVEKLLTFAILTKKMYSDAGKLIDTRPEELAKNPLEWFGKTANILVNKDTQELSFVDTRWLWESDSRIGRNGLDLVKHLGIRSIDNAIRKFANMLKLTMKNNSDSK